jgi:hypothetical protein
MTKEYFQSLAGFLRGGNNMEDVLAEKKWEIEHDEKRCL